MKKLFTFESFEKLIQIIAICITAIAMLSILESCGSEYVNCKSLTENRNVLPLHALNIAGEKDLNIVFLPEGYTVDQMDDFVAEVNVAWGILRQTKPYCHSLDRINVYYSTAMASATDSLGSGHTVFALGTPKPLRASCEISLDSIINVTKRLPFDADKTVLVIMVNVGGNIQLGFTILSKPEPKMLLPETVVIRSLFYRYPAAFTHEMGHAIARHGNERMTQQALSNIVGAVTGQIIGLKTSESGRVLFETAYAIGSQYGYLLPFSRKHELEADEIGLYIMAIAGYDITQAPLLWEKMAQAKTTDVPEVLSTHPSDAKRMKNLQQLIEKARKYSTSK